MTPLVKQEDQDFIARFLTIYKSLNEESQNLVLAFVRGMEFQREIEREGGREDEHINQYLQKRT